jgi:hypothetical protein
MRRWRHLPPPLAQAPVFVTLDRYGHLFPSLQERLAEGLEAAYRAAEKAPRTPSADLLTIPSS